MGKPVVPGETSWQFTIGENSNSEESRRSQRNKDLEEIRRNALAVKRKLRGMPITFKTRSKFEKTLSQFASKRREIEDAVQIKNPLLLKSSRNEEDQSQGNHFLLARSKNNTQKQDFTAGNPKIINDKTLQKPLNIRGFFRAGVKGKQLTRPLTSAERFKHAVLNNDALDIFQSGNFLRPKPSEPAEDLDPLIKMEISKVLKEFTDSSDTDDPVSVDNFKSSPVFKRLRKNASTVKSNSTKQFIIKNKHIAKEDKCKRRLFEEENSDVDNGNSKYHNNSQYENNDAIRFSQRKSTPENVIFFSEYEPAKDVNITSKRSKNKINPSDPKLIKYYIQTCKMMAQNDLRNVFKNILEDPMKNARAALRTTYASAFKNYLNRQKSDKDKQRSQSADLYSELSTSEIMVEPDSAIVRTLKKNNELQIQNTQSIKWGSDNNVNVAINNNDIEKALPNVGAVHTHVLKRKYAASSKSEQSDAEVPSSVKVNVDVDSERIANKMDLVHPDRQELTARYLNDVDLNTQQELTRCNSGDQRDFERGFSHHYEKKKLHVNKNNIEKTYFVSKSTKHIPAILRKNRSMVNCVSEEKVLLSIEKGPEHTEISNKALIRDNNTSDHNIISERTPNCSNLASNQVMEAPKCKYIYMNAKYNQPPRISAPVQVRRFHRNASSQKMHLFPAPHDARNSFIISQNLELSPIEKQVSFSEDLNDFQAFKLSQGSSSEIQERTNQLTLHSSQNCSQDSVDQMFTAPNNCYISHQNLYYGSSVPYNSQNISHNRGPTLQAYDVSFNPNANRRSQSVITCKDYQLQPENHAFRGTDDHNFCVINECQMYKNCPPQSSQQHQNHLMACIQKQNSRQPVKFIAIEGNRMPQRRPIYGIEDTNSCSHTHKPSVSSHQYSHQVINSCYQTAAPQQACFAMSSIPCHSGEVVKYDNAQREPSFISNEFQGPRRNVMNIIPNSMSDQNFVSQRNMPMHRDIRNQRYVAPMQLQISSPVHTHQVTYQQHNHRTNNEVYKVNDIYLQEMNHNVHQKRP